MKKIYIAGFDMFYPDGQARGAGMKELCARYGFEGLHPYDTGETQANRIVQGDLALIDACDIVVANVNPFRGREMDSGTAFELGYAHAGGKLLYGYLDDVRPMVEKWGTHDENGCFVEDFGLPLNIMIACTAKIVHGSFEDCLRQLQADQDNRVQ